MLAKKNPQVKKAVVKLLALTEDERARMLADSREKLRRDISAQIHAGEMRGWEEGLETGMEKGREEGLEEGLEKGMEKGMEKGLEEGKRLVARSLISLGHSVDVVVQATGLSREIVQSMLH
jgi:flagellar biosynthesis/type III secretory pathway protein FliH